jgi:hypothetical protein
MGSTLLLACWLRSVVSTSCWPACSWMGASGLQQCGQQGDMSCCCCCCCSGWWCLGACTAASGQRAYSRVWLRVQLDQHCGSASLGCNGCATHHLEAAPADRSSCCLCMGQAAQACLHHEIRYCIIDLAAGCSNASCDRAYTTAALLLRSHVLRCSRCAPVDHNNLRPHGVQADSAQLLGLCLSSPEIIQALLVVRLHGRQIQRLLDHASKVATRATRNMERGWQSNSCDIATNF